jgi:hypothetical protein
LIEKIRRALSIQHLKVSDYGLQIGDDGVARSRIEWDSTQVGAVSFCEGIGGREIDRNHFSRILMSYVGRRFKLTLATKNAELSAGQTRASFSMTRFGAQSQRSAPPSAAAAVPVFSARLLSPAALRRAL